MPRVKGKLAETDMRKVNNDALAAKLNAERAAEPEEVRYAEGIITTDEELFTDELKAAIADDSALVERIKSSTTQLDIDRERLLTTVADLRLDASNPADAALEQAADLKRRALEIDFLRLARLDARAVRVDLLTKECGAYASTLMNVVRLREAELEEKWGTRNLSYSAISELIETDEAYAAAWQAAQHWQGRGSFVIDTVAEARERGEIVARIRAAIS